ncbi:PleD family two-component system response regulator [Azovibrio restrictus]|uniref:response regulator n=1 Tax=Azovibrio restrictus TaxID=146938 RepID=UPI00042597FF|nr:response regulator [Azovibrio restrictus]MCE1170094.1 response regulator [Azovibrio sp.]MDD3483605.1 response regulator [Azovibrio restrictus]
MPVQKILVVDDSPTERFFVTDLLTKNGYQVITAENGEEGIAKAKAELPDLVIMDVVMPGLNGYQATRTLTRDEATKSIPVIVCTSKGQETDKIWGLRQGAMDYLVKPVNPEELLQKIAVLP